MNERILVREYLESLNERDELDYVFPILLESMGFKIISTPKQTQGLAQYGKDVVAIGEDRQGIRKRFYFELKGGQDKDIIDINKKDGIIESLREAKYRPYTDASNPDFEKLPVKIVLVHNGTIHPSVKETFDGFIKKEFPKKDNIGFARWDIYELTNLFTDHLFNEYLLIDKEAVKHFKKVLVLINTPGNNYNDFFALIDFILQKAGDLSKLNKRRQQLLFETLKMVSFIVYHYSKEAKNLEAIKKCLPYTILKLWAAIVRDGLSKNSKILDHFNKNLALLFQGFNDYFSITLPVARLKNGLWSFKGGRYEKIGYPVRALDYLSNLIVLYSLQDHFSEPNSPVQLQTLIEILNQNDGTTRPLLDNHSIPICLVLDFLIGQDKKEDAKNYLRNVLASIAKGYHTHKRLPDGRNSIESVIRFEVTRKKSVFFEDRTSHLLALLFSYIAALDMQEEYNGFKEFVESINIDLAFFMPYNDDELATYQSQNSKSHELHLLTHELYQEGYQAELRLEKDFEFFKSKVKNIKPFSYPYKTSQSGLPFLLTLAHVYYKTPFFPCIWNREAN
ncbi:MAG: hypothetical protein JST75_09555 [Bacteroidetes bacterium]|nr:hypothetical protein [Bacteroidota bacterium]